MSPSLDELRQAVALCRDARVRRLRWGSVEIELIPDHDSIEETEDPDKDWRFVGGVQPPNLRKLREGAE